LKINTSPNYQLLFARVVFQKLCGLEYVVNICTQKLHLHIKIKYNEIPNLLLSDEVVKIRSKQLGPTLTSRVSLVDTLSQKRQNIARY
jgi:hypothetical protein